MIGHLKFSIFLVLLICSAQVLRVAGQDDPDKKRSTTKATTTTTTTTESTTTPVPTTTPPPPKTTTGRTTTTTIKPTTPAPAPKKYPANEGKWSITDDNNVTCVILKGALELVVAYEDSAGHNQTANVDVPITANSSGSCGTGTILQTLTLTWPSVNGSNTVEFLFQSNATGVLETGTGISVGKYAIQNITGVLIKDAAIFINPKDTDNVDFQILNKAAFQTPLNHSYSCLAQEVLKSDDEKVTLKFSDIRMEAFRQTAAGHKEFSASIDCPADDASDLVPIAVGAALASLVVIVLIAYLIGRRRSRARGYQSV